MIKAVWFFYILSLAGHVVQGQDLEPRRYAALPKDMNAVAMVYGVTRGNVVSDAALPIADFKLTTNNLGVGYVRTFGLAGKLARVAMSVPFTFFRPMQFFADGIPVLPGVASAMRKSDWG